MRAKLRKHRVALLTLFAANLILFFPVLFLGRVVSPNDVFFNFHPWGSMQSVEVQNALIHDPPTAYLPLFSLLKSGREAFHWNPYIASGVPGFGSSAAAVLSPLIALPVLLAPLLWSYTLIIAAKLNLAFFLAYGWLREERMGKGSAAAGAIVAALAGPVALRWLWQSTNATVFYAALLWIICRWFRRKTVPWSLLPLLGVSYLLAGFPAAMLYGAYLSVAYVFYLLVRERRLPLRPFVGGMLAIVVSAAIAAPSLIPFASLVRRSGYLEMRSDASRGTFFPPAHLQGLLDSERLGNPALKNWRGDPALGVLNNYIESNLYLGALAIALSLIGLLRRRARHRLFFFLMSAVLIAAMFGTPGIASALGGLPGLKYSPLARLSLLLPVAMAYLVASGTAAIASRLRRWRAATAATALLGVLLATDLAVVAARFYSYLTPQAAEVPTTPTIDYLRAQPGPFRVAPTFDYFWPNAAELFRIEDIRSHFSSESRYRSLLRRIDPTAFSGNTTVIQFNSLKFNFTDPLVSMLGVRYILEHKAIDIIKWGTFAATRPGAEQQGYLSMRAGQQFQRTVTITELPFWAIEIPAAAEGEPAPGAALVAEVRRGEELLLQQTFGPGDLAGNKVYLQLGRRVAVGDVLHLRLAARGMDVALSRGSAPAGESPVFYGRVTTPIVLERELQDGRLFRNLAEVPRFHAVLRTRRMNDEQFLADRTLDFFEEAAITDRRELVMPMAFERARIQLVADQPSKMILDVDAPAGCFLATSEKLTPELRVTIDGREANPVEINMLFTGVEVPAGRHRLELSRRIGRGWWPVAALGLMIWIVVAGIELFRAARSYRLSAPVEPPE